MCYLADSVALSPDQAHGTGGRRPYRRPATYVGRTHREREAMAGKTAVRKTAAKKAPAKIVTSDATPPAKKAAAPKTNGVAGKRHPQFEKLLEEVLTNPDAAATFEDAQNRAKLARDFIALRNDRGMSQREVAQVYGGTQPDITKVENGTPLSVAAMQRVARALGAKLVVTLERC